MAKVEVIGSSRWKLSLLNIDISPLAAACNYTKIAYFLNIHTPFYHLCVKFNILFMMVDIADHL